MQLGISQYHARIEIDRSSLHQIILLETVETAAVGLCNYTLPLDCPTAGNITLFAQRLLLDAPGLWDQEQHHCLSTVLQFRYPNLVLTMSVNKLYKRIPPLIYHFLASWPKHVSQNRMNQDTPPVGSDTSGRAPPSHQTLGGMRS